jgi:hypothetical protein
VERDRNLKVCFKMEKKHHVCVPMGLSSTNEKESDVGERKDNYQKTILKEMKKDGVNGTGWNCLPPLGAHMSSTVVGERTVCMSG